MSRHVVEFWDGDRLMWRGSGPEPELDFVPGKSYVRVSIGGNHLARLGLPEDYTERVTCAAPSVTYIDRLEAFVAEVAAVPEVERRQAIVRFANAVRGHVLAAVAHEQYQQWGWEPRW